MKNIYDVFEDRKLRIEESEMLLESELMYKNLLEYIDSYDLNDNIILEANLRDNIKEKWDQFVKFISELWKKFTDWLNNIFSKMKSKEAEVTGLLDQYKISDVFFKIRDCETVVKYYDMSVKECINDALGFKHHFDTTMENMEDYIRKGDLELGEAYLVKFFGVRTLAELPESISHICHLDKMREKPLGRMSYYTIKNSLEFYDEAIKIIENSKQKSQKFYNSALASLKNDNENFEKRMAFIRKAFVIQQVIIRNFIMCINKIYLNHLNIYKKAIAEYNRLNSESQK